MGITYDELDADGVAQLTLTGLVTRTDHAAFTERVAAQIRAGRLRAVIIDASAAEVPASASFSRDVWEDFLSELGGRPFAYLPPAGHENAQRQEMIRTLVAEWDVRFATMAGIAQAHAWCLAQLGPKAH
ncbi:hypothetical protein [Maricaulis sp.]|uniref:hypothetical protein n=1 Tax=Maricaulis sp. TaxID=1486257 RepID=UPI002B27AEF0|nr:hypothetical protein [Maricaulis sp.]